MNQLNPVYTEQTECQDCYKCLRECGVKAIRVEAGHATIISELCVLCGHCVQVCPAGAKRIRDDLPRAKRLMQTKSTRIASLAPSFASEFPGISSEKLIAALRKLGFTAVSETARGADTVAATVAEDLRLLDGQRGLLISSACPTAMEYIKKYRPEFSSSLSSLYSPLLSHAKELKRLYGEECGIVFIGPCISKKLEADQHPELIDVAISFTDLARWLKEEGIHPQTLSTSKADRFEPGKAGNGTLYPLDGGMIEAVKTYKPPRDVSFMSFSGLSAIEQALEELQADKLSQPVFLELLACPGGCVNGPCSENPSGTIGKRLSVLDYAAKASKEAPVQPLDIREERIAAQVATHNYTEERIREALALTGKYCLDDEMNCGGCGYDTCRDFARALLDGRAEKEMCVSWMRKLAQKKANGLLKAIPSGVVIVDKQLKIVECNFNFVRLLGAEAQELWEAKPGLEGADLEKMIPFSRLFRDVLNDDKPLDRDIRCGRNILHASIFCIEQGSYAGAVLQDITAPWIRKDRVVSQAKKVITRNLALVQKIAWLLGENAAESEVILNSIIDSFADGGDKPLETGRE